MAQQQNKQAKSFIPEQYQPLATHLGILIGFLLLLFAYFNPLLEGRVLGMSDVQSFAGMSEEVRDFRAKSGEEAFWTNAIFGGMPTFHLGLQYPGNIINSIRKVYFELLPSPVSFIFLMFAGFYLLMNVIKVRPWMAAVGAMAFAFSSYFFIIMEAGHTSKAAAIGFMAPVIAGVILTYQGKILQGGILTAMALAFQISSNHVQMTYYLAFVLLFIGIAYGVKAIQDKMLPGFFTASLVLLFAGVLGTAPSTSLLWTTSEYASETIRGKSELTQAGAKESSGLDKEYALRYSYGIAETFTLMIPNFHGGASVSRVSRDSEAYKQTQSEMLPTYWGDQPPTSGPVYVGAIICFLFILGLLVVQGPMKWWLLAATIFSITLSWGRNMMWLTDIFFYNIPMYNKFRAVSMMLVIAELTMPILGVLALDKVLRYKEEKLDVEALGKKILIAGGITGGLSLLFWLAGTFFFNFSGRADASYQQGLVDLLRDVRISMFKADSIRAFLLIGASTAILWFYLKEKLKAPIALGIIGVLILGDMWNVNTRYLDHENFSRRQNYSKPTPTAASQFILRDQDPNYRVVNFFGGNLTNTVNNSQTAFFHKCIGGYHAAKLRRYQDLLDRNILPEMQRMIGTLQDNPTQTSINATLEQLTALNMLNTRYLIITPDQAPITNPFAKGNAWFVDEVQWVKSADEEIAALRNLDLDEKVIIDERFKESFGAFEASPDSNANIQQVYYSPNELVYETQSSRDLIAVFSEIYYNSGKGWKAYLDDKEVPHMRGNYVLRTMPIPAGKHTVTFKMEPSSYYAGERIALISSILLLVLSAVVILLPRIRKLRATS